MFWFCTYHIGAETHAISHISFNLLCVRLVLYLQRNRKDRILSKNKIKYRFYSYIYMCIYFYEYFYVLQIADNFNFSSDVRMEAVMNPYIVHPYISFSSTDERGFFLLRNCVLKRLVDLPISRRKCQRKCKIRQSILSADCAKALL